MSSFEKTKWMTYKVVAGLLNLFAMIVTGVLSFLYLPINVNGLIKHGECLRLDQASSFLPV